jgi:hypothetical protein
MPGCQRTSPSAENFYHTATNRTRHGDIVLANLGLLRTLSNVCFEDDSLFVDPDEVDRLTKTSAVPVGPTSPRTSSCFVVPAMKISRTVDPEVSRNRGCGSGNLSSRVSAACLLAGSRWPLNSMA